MATIEDNKIKFREFLKENRKNFVLQHKEETLNKQLLKAFQRLYLETQLIVKNSNIALYYPLKNEASTLLIMQWLQDRGHHLFLPKIINNSEHLVFIPYKVGDILGSGAFNIKEPQKVMPQKSEVKIASKVIKENQFQEKVYVEACNSLIDVVIVPLLGFDELGNRIGYGKGYYDKTVSAMLKQNKKLLYIGLAYSSQKVKGLLPVNQHDIPLKAIVTENDYQLYG